MPYEATLNIGASGSLFIAIIVSEDCIPTKCCTAPLIPHAIYTLGHTVFPVWPTPWGVVGFQWQQDADTATTRKERDYTDFGDYGMKKESQTERTTERGIRRCRR